MADTSSHLSTRSTTRCPIPPSLTEQMSLTNWISIGGQTGTKAKLWATAGYRSELLDKTWLLVGLQRDSHYCYYQFGILVRVCPGKHNAYRNEYSSNATYLILPARACESQYHPILFGYCDSNIGSTVLAACGRWELGWPSGSPVSACREERSRAFEACTRLTRKLSVYTCAWGKTTAASILKRKAHVKWYRMRQWPDTPRFSYLSLDSGESNPYAYLIQSVAAAAFTARFPLVDGVSRHIPGKSASPVGQQTAWTHRVTSSATRPLQPIKDIPSCIRNSLLIFVGSCAYSVQGYKLGSDSWDYIHQDRTYNSSGEKSTTSKRKKYLLHKCHGRLTNATARRSPLLMLEYT
ncbi:hypothetical protein TRIATDRAFT_282037 [Trichoderma atroviride IMI 206040]|uniref:Uncharacterized protein n=1 Tax=Hypocrea atroviridis (strain ATCC 20476 / IMI 206040) TaxID=452589 RepID=G9NPA6_HYPAI|nr:uncharacterized protein TRIATDRAFT_282037 [Trichoderma atroviride IMI 206040]EHK47378.1 hypothetical protein TRIATDRAFT_282037 [Trichoderma atroviride IMI 206040]